MEKIEQKWPRKKHTVESRAHPGPCHKEYKNTLVKQKNPEGTVMAPIETQPMTREPDNSSSPNPHNGAGIDANTADNTIEKDQQDTKNLQTGWCEIYKINFGIKILESHILGKKQLISKEAKLRS